MFSLQLCESDKHTSKKTSRIDKAWWGKIKNYAPYFTLFSSVSGRISKSFCLRVWNVAPEQIWLAPLAFKPPKTAPEHPWKQLKPQHGDPPAYATQRQSCVMWKQKHPLINNSHHLSAGLRRLGDDQSLLLIPQSPTLNGLSPTSPAPGYLHDLSRFLSLTRVLLGVQLDYTHTNTQGLAHKQTRKYPQHWPGPRRCLTW